MIHISGISESQQRKHKSFTAGKYHEALPAVRAELTHPVAAHLKLSLRTTELEENTLKIVIIESEGI